MGQTRIWNGAGVEPRGCCDLIDDRGNQAWRGDASLPTTEQGVTVLGTPIGHPHFVQNKLHQLSIKHSSLLKAIPEVPDLQSAWLLLSYCAATRANYYLRAIPPSEVMEFAQNHDQSMWECLKELLGTELQGESE